MWENASTIEVGMAAVFTGVAENPRAACHVRLVANVSRQKRTQRLTVFALTRKRSLDQLAIRVKPLRAFGADDDFITILEGLPYLP